MPGGRRQPSVDAAQKPRLIETLRGGIEPLEFDLCPQFDDALGRNLKSSDALTELRPMKAYSLSRQTDNSGRSRLQSRTVADRPPQRRLGRATRLDKIVDFDPRFAAQINQFAR